MAKQLATISLSRKKELDRPDEVSTFLSRILEYCVKNRNTILAGLAGVILLAMILSGYRYYTIQSEEKASAMLTDVLNRYRAITEKQGSKEALMQVRSDFEAIETRFGRTKAAGFARIHAAGMFYDAGEYQGAVAMYETLLKSMKASDPFRGLVLIGMGYAQEATGKTDTAVRYLEEALAASSPMMHGEIRFHLGRLYATTGQTEKSMEAYRAIVTENEDSQYYDMARNIVGI